MMGLQKERFQHLVAVSVMDIWRKETGSQMPVFLEGTICITSCSGRMTVVQLSNRCPIFQTYSNQSPPDSPVEGASLKNSVCNVEGCGGGVDGCTDGCGYGSGKQKDGVVDENNNVDMYSMPSTMKNASDDEDDEVFVDDYDDEKLDVCNNYNKEDGKIEDSIKGDSEKENVDKNNPEKKKDSSEVADDSGIQDMSLNRPDVAKEHQNVCSIPSNNSFVLSSQLQQNLENLFPAGSSLLSSNAILNQKMILSNAQKDCNKNFLFYNNPFSSISSNFKTENDKRVVTASPVKEDKPFSPFQPSLSPFFPPFLPAAHTSNFFNQYKGLPAMLAAHSSAVKDLTNRSYSVPTFSLQEKHSLDLIGQLKNVQTTPRNESSNTTNNEQKIYKCLYCQKTFLFKSKYHEHLPVHTSARPFQCHLCSRTYKYKYDLRVHLRTHLGIPTKSTICPFCSVKFSTNKQLRLHIKEEHNEQQRISDQQCAQSLLLAPGTHA